ncbi:hypothetical protein Y032_0202g1775 [Ancylostoma ceylanicum]|uniref:Uncharacterized protein n=1 Tax=Ancylostoma ceylanicum TaxID=53326 RepID=A0A016SMZ7_9BILA|nr:hypothetical protein Y032_0202g1775 [Ancylostoma ceylanicum]
MKLSQTALAKKWAWLAVYGSRSSIRAFAPPTIGVHSNVVVRAELTMLQLQYFNDEYDCDKNELQTAVNKRWDRGAAFLGRDAVAPHAGSGVNSPLSLTL